MCKDVCLTDDQISLMLAIINQYNMQHQKDMQAPGLDAVVVTGMQKEKKAIDELNEILHKAIFK